MRVTFAPDSLARSVLDIIGVPHNLAALLRRRADRVEAEALDPFIQATVFAAKRVIYR
ncbi:MAG: hypothetical protein K6V97_09570 [Actinomycetia bacterium]|nr:hypothetical protein [Actinomycetes bacterium]